MTQNLKEFLNQEDIQEALASYNFKYIYEQLDKLSNQWEYIPKFTELMLSVGYNPLDYMDYVPDFFLYDSSIKEFTIPNHIARIDVAAFKGCINLTNITIPDKVTSIGTSAFYECSNLVNITIPDKVTSIGSYTFYHCTNLTSIMMPEGVTSIGTSAFYECSNLVNITIPDKVTSIERYTFYHCTNLTSITIPSTLDTIGYNAFNRCPNLKTVYYEGTKDQWGAINIIQGNEELEQANIIFKGEK